MATKKPPSQENQQKEKPTVKFEKPGDSEPQSVSKEQDLQKPFYMPPEVCRENAIKIFNQSDSQFKLYTKNDPEIKRKDTARSLVIILNNIKSALESLNLGSFEDKMKNYYLAFNGTIYLFDICQFLRKSVYAYLTVNYIAFAIITLEGHLVLLGIKYLEWRVKLYVELAHVYEEIGSMQAAGKTVEVGLAKINELKELEESDPPLPDYVQKIFENTLRILKILDIKFKLQNGVIKGEEFKKKIEESFQNDSNGKIIAITESLKINNPKSFNIIEKQGTNFLWKEQAVQISYDMVKKDIETISSSLIQQRELIDLKQQYKQKSLTLNEDEKTQELVVINDHKKNSVSEQDFKRASEAVPFEFHLELIKHSYDINNIQLFEELSSSALIRAKYRRLEVPYIQHVDIITDFHSNPTIQNGYEKIPIDLNEASLKIELSKLRNKTQVKKEEQKIEKDKKAPPAKKDDKKGQQVPQQQIQPKQQRQQLGTEAELAQIQHQYTYLVVKRSLNPEQAVYQLDVQMAPEDEEEKWSYERLSEGWSAIAMPVDQYTGVRETNHKIPYLCFKQSADSLKDESEKLTLLTDVLPLIGKNPLIRPNFGYDKIDIDLRQVPKEFIRLPNNDYVYITYKTEKLFFVCERELQILTAFNELEKTFGKEKVSNLQEEKMLELDISYDLEKFMEFNRVLKRCLEGPLGEQFVQKRKDLLMQLSFYVWKNYYVNQLSQIEHVYQLRIFNEINDSQFQQYKDIINQAVPIFSEGLKVINLILMNNDQVDIIWQIKLTLELSKLLEINGQFKIAVQHLRYCLTRIIQYRDQKLERGVQSHSDLFITQSLTCSNELILQTTQKMRDKYIEYKNMIGRKIREKERNNIGKQPLNQEEAKEEENEIIDAYQIYLNDDNKDKQYFEALNDEKPIKELDLIINALHADILLNLFRNELKQGKYLAKTLKLKRKLYQNQTGQNNSEELAGIGEKIKMKMNILKGPTAQSIKKNLNQLQKTLQNAGQMEPPKPLTSEQEALLQQETNKNDYANALLTMMMACNKSKFPEQRYLLNKALEFIQKAQAQESEHLKNSIQNAVYVLSTLLNEVHIEKDSSQFYPFSYLYKQDFIKETRIPPKPVLISRNSHSITMKLPQYNPKIDSDVLGDEVENQKKINTMALYGKISANGVNVSLTCNDLQNTGIQYQLGNIITVTSLEKNENYCFAVGAFNNNEEISNGIGETGEDICTAHPLPVNLLYAYLAKVAYQLGDFEIAQKTAEFCAMFFIERSNIKERWLNYQDNPLLFWRLRQKAIHAVSVLEIKNLTETFIIIARCLQFKYNEQSNQQSSKIAPIMPLTQQKNTFRVCNFFLLALETCLATNDFSAAKRISLEIYNIIIPLLEMKLMSHFLFQITLKTQIILTEIPSQYWDEKLRKLLNCLTYQILRLCFQYNELSLVKRIIFSEIKLPLKKFQAVSKIQMIPEQSLQQRDDKKKVDNKKKPKEEAKKVQSQQQPEQVEEVKLVPKLIREIFEKPSLQDFFEEALLSFSEEYGEFVLNFIENWREQIDQLLPYIDNGNDIGEKLKQSLNNKFDFWEMIRDPQTCFLKVQATYKTSPYYLEFTCKAIKRLIEIQQDPKQLQDICMQVVDPNHENIAILNEIRDLQLNCIENDIEWHPLGVQELIREKNTNKGVGNDIAIDIFQSFLEKDQILKRKSLEDIHKFRYMNIWRSEFYFLKAVVGYLFKIKSNQKVQEIKGDQYFEITKMDMKKLNSQIEMNKLIEDNKIPDQQQSQMLNQIFQNLCYSSFYALKSKAWYQLQNVIKFLYNIMVYDMITPFDHLQNDLWKYLVQICLNITEMLETIQQEGFESSDQNCPVDPYLQDLLQQEKQQNNQDQQLENQNQQQEQSNIQFQIVEHEPPTLISTLSKSFWFKSFNQIDIQVIGNVISYTIQTLMVEQKWQNLISISRNFCNASQHYYSNYILPFTIYAKNIKFLQAQEQTNLKEEALKQRSLDFEKWKSTNKRRKTRAAMITGEVPQEQIDYERDAKELTRQIQLAQQKQDQIQNKKQLAESVLSQINRDANQAVERLKESRKLLEQYGEEEKQIMLQEETDEAQYLGKKKIQKTFVASILNTYKQTIELLRARDEKFALIQALNEYGNLYFSMSTSSFKLAEEQWSDSLDTIFQSYASLKNFRKIFADSGNIAQTFGIPQCLIGVQLLHKIGNMCNYANMHIQREAMLMAAELTFSIYKTSLPHPHVLIKYSEYRLKEIYNAEQIFGDKYVVDPAQLLIACDKIAWNLIDMNQNIKSLPVIVLVDYLATEILNSVYYSVRAKLTKSIALSNLSCINESYQNLQYIIFEKNLPMPWIKQNEFVMKEKGSNWSSPYNPYLNSHSFHHEKNKEQLEHINKLELPKNFNLKYGNSNATLFIYAKSKLQFCIYEAEIFEKQETNEVRIQMLKQIENCLRQTLKKISFEEEFYFMVNNYQKQINKQENQDIQQSEQMKSELVNYLLSNQIESQYVDSYIEMNEESQSYFELRNERLLMIARIRFDLFQINYAMNYLTRGYFILKHAIKNLYEYFHEGRAIETGFEPENEQAAEIKQGGQADQKKGKNAPQKDDKKKPDPKSKGKDPKDDEEKKLAEEKRNLQIQQESEMTRKLSQERKFKRHIDGFWWVKIRTQVCQILYEQNQYKECIELIQIVKGDCKVLNDTFFNRVLDDIQARVYFKEGKLEDSMKKFEESLTLGRSLYHDDLTFGKLMGDFGEILMEKKMYQKAMEQFVNAKNIFENYLKLLSYDPQQVNYNLKAAEDQVKVYDKYQLTADQEQDILRKGDRIKIGKKEEKRKDDAKGLKKEVKGGKGAKAELEVLEMKINPLNALNQQDYSIENKLTYQKLDQFESINSMELIHNSYFWKYSEQYIRAILRQIDAYFILKQDQLTQKIDDNILQVLTKIEIVISKNFNVPISLKLVLNYLFSKYYKRKFLEEVFEVQSKYAGFYSKDRVKKFKKLYSRQPYRDLARNKYMLEVPNFNQMLKEQLLGFLHQSMENLQNCLKIIKGECLFYEFNEKVEDIFVEIAEVCLLMREYRLRVGYKYLDSDKIQEQMKNLVKKENQENDFEAQIDKQKKDAHLEQLNLELEAYTYLSYAIQTTQQKRELNEKYSLLGQKQILDSDKSKLSYDIYLDIIEQDYLYKKNYDQGLFDESKKKQDFNSLDLFTYINKITRESKCMTFSGNKHQRNLSKIHRFLKIYLSAYSQKTESTRGCVLNTIEFGRKTDENQVFINEGNFIFKNIYCKKNEEYKFFYILGPLNKEKIKSEISLEEIQKFIINQEKQTLYGTIYISSSELDYLQKSLLELKLKMMSSNEKSQNVKERDYNYYRQDFQSFIESFAKIYFLKDQSLKSRRRKQEKEDSQIVDYLEQYVHILPETNLIHVEMMINMISYVGLESSSYQNADVNNFLAIFRYFHNIKYK